MVLSLVVSLVLSLVSLVVSLGNITAWYCHYSSVTGIVTSSVTVMYHRVGQYYCQYNYICNRAETNTGY